MRQTSGLFARSRASEHRYLFDITDFFGFFDVFRLLRCVFGCKLFRIAFILRRENRYLIRFVELIQNALLHKHIHDRFRKLRLTFELIYRNYLASVSRFHNVGGGVLAETGKRRKRQTYFPVLGQELISVRFVKIDRKELETARIVFENELQRIVIRSFLLAHFRFRAF